MMRHFTFPLLASVLPGAFIALPCNPAFASPFVVPDMEAADAFAIKVIAEHSRSEDGHDWAVPTFDLTAPITPGLEIAVAFGRSHVHSDGVTARNGWSDTEIAAKWELKPITEEGGFGITIAPVLILPIGDGEVSENDWRAELPIVLGWRTGPLTLHAMLGYSTSLSNKGDTVPFGILATYEINDRMALGTEILGNAPVDDLTGYDATANIGMSYSITGSWSVELRLGSTLRAAEEERATNIVFAIEKSF